MQNFKRFVGASAIVAAFFMAGGSAAGAEKIGWLSAKQLEPLLKQAKGLRSQLGKVYVDALRARKPGQSCTIGSCTLNGNASGLFLDGGRKGMWASLERLGGKKNTRGAPASFSIDVPMNGSMPNDDAGKLHVQIRMEKGMPIQVFQSIATLTNRGNTMVDHTWSAAFDHRLQVTTQPQVERHSSPADGAP